MYFKDSSNAENCAAVTKSLGKCKQLIGKRLNSDSDQTLYWREPCSLDPTSLACWNNAVPVFTEFTVVVSAD